MNQDTPNRLKFSIDLNLSEDQFETLKSWRLLLNNYTKEMYRRAGEYKDSLLFRVKICHQLRQQMLGMTDVPMLFCKPVYLEYPPLTFLILKANRVKPRVKIPGIKYYIDIPKTIEFQPLSVTIDLENKCAVFILNTEEPYFVANKVTNRKKEYVWFGSYGLKNGPISGSNIVLVRQNNRSVPFYDPKGCIAKLCESVNKNERRQRIVIFKEYGKSKVVLCIPCANVMDTLFKYSKLNRKTIEIVAILNIIHADWFSEVRRLNKPVIKNSPYSFFLTSIESLLAGKFASNQI